MFIGVDFDNTIVCYDQIFHSDAVRRGWIPADTAVTKHEVREYLRNSGREDDWTRLQAVVYGQMIESAPPFPDAHEFFRQCAKQGIDTAIVSHRTRLPLRPPLVDLHQAAQNWLKRFGFEDLVALGAGGIHLVETRQKKLDCIARLGCTHFIDDLPELFAEPNYPAGVTRILFDPHQLHEDCAEVQHVRSWAQIVQQLGLRPQPMTTSDDSLARSAISRLLRSIGRDGQFSLHAIPGGRNNRVYRVVLDEDNLLAKHYFSHPGDERDRLTAEYEFCQFAQNHGIKCIPRPLARDAQASVGVYAFVNGRRLNPNQVRHQHLMAAAGLLNDLSRHRSAPDADRLQDASEACFSLQDHVAHVDRRVRAFDQIDGLSDAAAEAAGFCNNRLRPVWERVCETALRRADRLGIATDVKLKRTQRCISPSDFGFHNALCDADGQLVFLDFEYAGWDDPAKTVCDFFCQVEVPVPSEWIASFLDAILPSFPDADVLRLRTELLLPVYRVKWCCILLNDYLPIGSARRQFGFQPTTDSGESQIEKARRMLARIEGGEL